MRPGKQPVRPPALPTGGGAPPGWCGSAWAREQGARAREQGRRDLERQPLGRGVAAAPRPSCACRCVPGVGEQMFRRGRWPGNVASSLCPASGPRVQAELPALLSLRTALGLGELPGSGGPRGGHESLGLKIKRVKSRSSVFPFEATCACRGIPGSVVALRGGRGPPAGPEPRAVQAAGGDSLSPGPRPAPPLVLAPVRARLGQGWTDGGGGPHSQQLRVSGRGWTVCG